MKGASVSVLSEREKEKVWREKDNKPLCLSLFFCLSLRLCPPPFYLFLCLYLSLSLSVFPPSGIPRHIESQDEYSRREPKQLKRECSPPPRGSDAIKVRPHDSLVPTVKEGGRSIHLIPPEGVLMSKAPKEGSITQVPQSQGPALSIFTVITI